MRLFQIRKCVHFKCENVGRWKLVRCSESISEVVAGEIQKNSNIKTCKKITINVILEVLLL